MKSFVNIINNSKIKHALILILLFSLYVFISAYSYVNAVSSDIANSVFRLHVLANSDSQEDQNLKLKVRDDLLSYMNEISKNATSKQEAINIAKLHEDDFYQIARETIINNGYDYDVTIQIGNFDFPTKQYGDISLPAGNYDALRVEIGQAKGHNWWCVMFPPLCFVDISSGIVPEESKQEIQENLSSEEYGLISNQENKGLQFKFKLIEMFKNVTLQMAQN